MKSNLFISIILFVALAACKQGPINFLDLEGEWYFKTDPLKKGIEEEWFLQSLPERVQLPGSMAENGKGEDITTDTEWTGTIVDRSWFTDEKYKRYRQEGNIKIPFWLQPEKHYIGVAWYQKEVEVPEAWPGRYLELFLERPHWETQVWVNDRFIDMQNTLATPHIYDLSEFLKTGTNRISIRVDNSIRDINPGINSHSISDHTQSNWNGIAGRIYLQSRPSVYIDQIKTYPDILNKEVIVKAYIKNMTGAPRKAELNIEMFLKEGPSGDRIPGSMREIEINDNSEYEFRFPVGPDLKLWDEFYPHVYTLKLTLTSTQGTDEKQVDFGMREFQADGTRFTINGRPVFLRGTVECAVFPETGYPPTEVDEWKRIFQTCKDHGLNHMRFHSWCPPEAAFEAADAAGIYLHVECSSWANQGSSIGDGNPIDSWLYQEARSILDTYGNHPSFCMMAYGNEPAGENQVDYLSGFVDHWRSEDPRRVYTGGAAWPFIENADYYLAPDARIQGWGQELNSIINKEPPQTMFDWAEVIREIDMPYVSHEIGQWCVYPDFREIDQYTGVLKARNFEIFRESLTENHMGYLADSFRIASGKLQAICYKADIEAALRTKNFAGFQLLQLNDFPGQGTALVGILNPFWKEKGYISPEAFRRFCGQTVPLVRIAKRVFLDNETIIAQVEVAHYGAGTLSDITPAWTLTSSDGEVISKGILPARNIPVGNGIKLGQIRVEPQKLERARKLVLTVSLSEFSNSWDLWVYPSKNNPIEDEDMIRIVRNLDDKTRGFLDNGDKVLFSPGKGRLKAEFGGDIGIGFSSIFWNTAWTNGQKPHTLGILCNPEHPALAEFPTEFHSNWQWWDAMSHSNAIVLDTFPAGLTPLVRIIDDWFNNRRLALIYEAKVGNGKIIVSGIDLLSNMKDRPEARQLLYSLKKYMVSEAFDPGFKADFGTLQEMYNPD